MAFKDWLKEYRESQDSNGTSSEGSSTTTSTTSEKSTSSSNGSGNSGSFSDWLSEYREKRATSSVEGWVESSLNILNDAQNRVSKWFDSSAHESMSSKYSSLLAQADNWRKQYTGNDEVISYINSVVDALSKAKSYTWDRYQTYSKFNSQEEFDNAVQAGKEQYIRSSEETREDRQKRYEDNQKRIEELKKELEWLDTTGVDDYDWTDADDRKAYNERWEAIESEIASIESDMRQYERGEDGYTSKTVDDYFNLTLNPDFEQGSANRDFGNASKTDYDKWYAQAYGGAAIDPKTMNEVWYYDGRDGNQADVDKESLVINDPLGWYLDAQRSADSGEIFYVSNQIAAREYDSVWVQGKVDCWDELTEGEISIYYYLFNTQGSEAAIKYLEDMKLELNKRATNTAIESYAKLYDNADVLGKILLNVATVPANVFGGTAAFFEDTVATIQGKDINPYSAAHAGMHFSNTIRGETAADLDETGFVIPIVDFSLGDIYQVGMARLDSALATGIGGRAGTILLGMSSAENEAYRLYQSGASAEQITWGALTAGAAEAVFEYVSFDKLVKMKDVKTVGQWVKNALIQGGIEASEEGFTDIANTITNAIIMGSESDWAKLVEENGGDTWKAFLSKVQETAQSAFGGFLAGAPSGTIASAASYSQANKQYTSDGKAIMYADGGVDALKNLANEVAGVSSDKVMNRLNNMAGKVSSETATGKGVGKVFAGVKNRNNANKVGRLYEAVQTANDTANASANKADIAKSLVRKGFSSETANDIAEVLVANYNGEQLTKTQSQLLESAMGNKVVQEALSNIVTNTQSTMGQRRQNIRDFQKDVKAGGISRAFGISKDTARELVEGKVNAEAENALESHYEVSEDGNMINSETGDVIDPQGLVQAADGTYMIAGKDADPVASSKVSYADIGQAIVFETFVNLESRYGKTSRVIADMDLASRNALLSLYNPQINKDGGKFINGILDSYFYGHRGVDLSAASKDSPMWELTEQQRKIAWNTGRAAGIKADTKVQSNVDTVYAEAKKILESGKAKKGSYHAVLEDGISPTELNNAQKAVYRYADEIAQGVQTHIRVYKGKNKAQGFYNHKTDEIWLNLNAANTGREAIMAFTLAHELVHRAKKGSPAKYQAFVDFLMKEYGKQGSNVEAMIAEQIQAAEEFNKTVPEAQRVNMTREKALEEVVCDACQRMLLDTNAGQKLAEFGAQSKENKSFLEDLKRWITELLDKLRSYFRNAEPDSLAAKAFAKFDANVKQILADMYVDMSIDAGEKLSTIKAAYGEQFADKFFGIKDIRYNLAAVDSHKAKMQKAYSEDSSTDLKTIMARYDKIIDIWTRLGGELNSKFLEEWNSKVGKDRSFTIFKAQAGYKYNVELSSMCKKGVPLFEAIDTIVKQEVMKELGTEVLGKAEKEILYDILKQHHFEIPCAICYVEQARQREGVIIDAFLNGKVEKNAKGETTKVKLGWNQVLDSIEKEMKANGVDYTFAQVSRDIATDRYSPAILEMDEKTTDAFYAALKKIANQEISRYNKAEGKSRKLLTDVTPAAVKECFKGTLPSNLKIFKVLFNESKSRFKVQNDLLYSSLTTQNLSMAHNELYSLFNSQGGVSGYKTKQGTTIYWGDILGKSWKPDTLRNEGGVRNQSNSDFQMYTLLDQAQMYLDFTAKGYYLQAYTKVLSELKLFGLSRGKINASLIPKVVVYYNADGSVDIEKTMATAGLDENGNPIYDDIEGINHDEAFMLIEDPEYSKSICGICIGYSDAHINKLLDDNRVQQIIGFHDKTDDGTKRYKGARYAKNYNGLNEAVNKEGKTVHIGFNPYVKRAEKKFKFNAETETFEGTVNYNGKTYTADDIPRLATALYLEMCAKKEYTPAYKDFAGHRNYYKLLADFGLYDSQGHYAPHRKVVFNMPDTVPYLDTNGKKQTMKSSDYIKAELEKELAVRDSISEALADTSSEGIIPQFKAAVKKAQEEKSFSLPKTDSEGNQLSAEQQEFFKDSVVRDAEGKLMVMYHGTANGGAFTVFDGDKLNNDPRTTQVGQGFYFTNVRKEAESYTRNVDIYGKVSAGRNPHLHQVYLNITSPFNIDTDTIDIAKVKSVYMDGTDDWFFSNWIPFYLNKKTVNGSVLTKAEIQAMSKADKVSVYLDYLTSLGTKEVLSNMVRAFPYGKQSDLLASMRNRLGYDGIVEEFKPGQYQYVAFSSEQVKTIDNQNPTTNPDIRYSLPKGNPAPTFYSQMARVVDGVKQEKLGAASVVSMLRGKGVKAEEIKWSGIETWLEGKKSVTKAELQEFIAGSMLQIEEEILDNKDRPYSEDQQKRLDEYEAKRDEVAKRLAGEWKKITGEEFPIRNTGAGLESAVSNAIIDANLEQKNKSFEGRLLAKLRKDLQTVIENNDDFGFDSGKDALRSIHRHRKDFIKHYEMSADDKAVIVKYCNALNAYNELSNRISDEDTDRLRAIARETDPWNRKIMEVKHEHNEEEAKFMTNWGQYRLEGGKNYREMLFRIPGSTYSNEAMYTHWKERKGVLAHARVQDIDTFIGKMLFIEEIQSDWHNAGHKDGYRDPALEDKHTLSKKMEEYTEEFYASAIADVVRERIAPIGYEGAGVSMILNFLLDSQESMESTLNTLSRKGASFTESEVSEIAKYAREYEEMYHKWETAPGDLTAPDAPFKDTYHEYVMKRLLREAAEQDYDSIGWTPSDVQMERWNPNRKTNAQMGLTDAKNPDAVAFEEGYRIEYDRDIPKFLSKYGKKWEAKVGKTVLDNGTEVWSMAITDSMKDSVLYEGQVMYSLPKVKPVQSTTDKWRRTHDTDEVKAQFPDLWDVSADESEVRNPTQISGTVKSYRKIYEYLKAEGFSGSILDASSGLGYGTRAGIEEYGFDVEDIEPYPDKSYSPKYTDYSALHKKYDVIISNAVLNVLPQDQRDALVVKMASLLRDGGRIFINVRGRDVENASSKVAIDKDLMEYYISNTGSYQKGFTKSELVAYLEDALGEGYRVNPTSMFGAVSAVVTKVNPYEGKKLYENREVYNYDFMTARDPMVVATMPSLSTVKENGMVSLDKAVKLGLESAKQLGREIAEDQYAVVNAYTSREVIVGQHGLEHSLGGENIYRLRTNARLTAIGGELVRNAIPINGLRNKNRQAVGTYAMACLVNDNNSKTVAIITVEEHTSKVVDIGYVDITHSVNGRFLGKKRDSRSSTRESRYGLDEAALATAISEISIADFLEIVNMTHRSILSESVLQKFEETRPADGHYTGEALFKLPVGEDTSPRALLANAFEGIITNDTEKQKIQEYKGKVEMLNAEEQKLHELRAQIKELSFAKGKRDTKKIKELQFDAVHTENRIATLDKVLLRLEAAAPLQNILKREKEMAYKRAEQKGKEALKAYREAEAERDKQWHSQVKDKYQASKKQAIETREKRDAREKLQKLVLDTVKWITYPTKTDEKCPDILKQPYADFLNGIDLSSKRLANGGDPTKNDLRLANAMGSLATALDKIMTSQDPAQETDKVLDTGYLDLPADFVQKLRDMTENVKAMMTDGDYVVNNMSAAEVRQLSQMIRTLNHAIKEVSTLYANLRFANVEALGDSTMSFMDDLGEIEKAGGVKDFVQWDNALPYYAFKRFGEGGESIFEGLMDAQDKLAFLAKKIFAFQEKVWTGKEAKEWSEDTHEIDLPNGSKLTLTTADAMSIYCLSRREQGLQHLLGGGTRVMGIQKGAKKAKDSRSLLTIKDIESINESLTDRQRAVAEAIQEFMSTVCSDWGNEISMKRFLTKEFTEKFYFPIESNDENLPTKDPAAQQSDLFRLLNISATKPLTPGANNEVIIRNIFDVFTGHASDMARLNAYGMALLDYMKWLNYREKAVNEEGQIKVRGVRKSMELAYGNAAKSYVLNLIKDVNGRPSDGGLPSFYTRMVRNAKTAMVGSSLRVATLQITSYPRAALVLSPKSLALGLSKIPNINKAKKYCGIALWKSFGFYDTNISRSIEDQMKGVKDVKQKLIELSLKGAEWGDAITWGCLWNACEYEVASAKKYEVGSEEFNQAVGKKLSEVVYATQVVDSTLTRSEMMRSKNAKAQELSAFMSEPTLSANILMDAGFQFNAEKRRTGSAKAAWKKTGKYIGRVVAVYSIGQLAAALLEGLWDAWRDDEDEEFGEKFLNAFTENLVLDLLPFNKIPILSELAEATLSMVGLGYFSSDSLSSTALSQTVSAVKAWTEVLGDDSSMTVYNALYKTMRAVSSFYGVSFSGVMREGVALWNNTAGAYDITLKVRNWELSNADLAGEVLDAILEGNNRQADSIRAEFTDEDSYKSAMRTAIKDKYTAGEIDYDTAIQYLVKYGGMDEDDAYWKAEEWKYEADTDDDFAKYDEFFTAAETGKNLKAVIKKYTDNGVKIETLASQLTSHFKPLYIEMTASQRAGIKGYLLNAFEQCGVDREDATKKLQYWDFLSEQPDSDLTQYQIADYYEFAKPAGISADLYSEYCEKVKGIDGDNKKQRRMAVIHSLPLTSAQKDALYYAEGWAASKLYEAPWH